MALQNLSAQSLKSFLTKSNGSVVLWGAGDLGELVKFAFEKAGIKVDFFCDTNEKKQNKDYLGIPVLSPKKLFSFENKNTNVFISCNYVEVIKGELDKKSFENIFHCYDLLSKTDFSSNGQIKSIHPLKIERRIDYYKNMCLKEKYASSKILHVKSLDIQITERCSLKCKDCSNLMQYYEKPQNSELSTMLESIDKFINIVDEIYELRVLGGDPFMSKDLHKVVDKLKTYEKVKKIIIYTNAKIVPKGDNLECLKNNKKIILDIANYGQFSTIHDQLLNLLDENKIKYSTTRYTNWQDCGRILPNQNRTEEETKRVFYNCCNSDLISLLHGKLYRCPFSANATNLKAIPVDETDIVDLTNNEINNNELKEKIRNLVYGKEYLTACSFCNGRDYSVKAINAAEQTKKPLSFKKVDSETFSEKKQINISNT
tara:strand:+ start:1308 stop:2594 length:1287 start_codon:yes stop_codon:yes gene_type:complete